MNRKKPGSRHIESETASAPCKQLLINPRDESHCSLHLTAVLFAQSSMQSLPPLGGRHGLKLSVLTMLEAGFRLV
jgi:hypothetical protein